MMNDIFTKNRQRIALRQATHFSSILSTVNKFLVSNIRSRSSAQSTRRTAKHEANYREVIVRVRSSAKLFPQRLKKQSETDISSPLHHLVQESVRMYSSPSIHGWSGPLRPPEMKQIMFNCTTMAIVLDYSVESPQLRISA